MKKLVLALLAVASIGTANAQKGSVLVYGTAGVDFNNVDNGAAVGSDKTTMWNITPGIGYQISNHITLGVQGGYMNTLRETAGTNGNVPPIYMMENTRKDREWTVGAFFRHTQHLVGIFSMWTQLDAGYVAGKWTNENLLLSNPAIITKGSDTYNGLQFALTPAIAVAVHNGWALNFSVGGLRYRTVTYETAPTTINHFGITFGNQFNIGISKNIGGCCSGHHHMGPNGDMHKMKKTVDEDED